ncbi:MAG: tetratricopeptide repeat protein [Blastocatellia bacterium]|nr:tetratricopeptide repeat protein [Blastocatellia bacterium]
MAIINIHHFILDGAIWKLRDSKISGLLIGNSNVIKTVGESSSRSIKEILTYTKSLFTGSSSLARAARFALLFLLFLLAGIDQARFYLGFNEKNPTNMAKAEILNPYDATLYLRMARADRRVGDVDQTLAKLERVVMLNPHSREAQQILGQILIEKQRYADAYLHYKQMLEKITPDKDSLINFSTLASKLGKTDEAIDGWRRVLEIEPENKTVRLYLAETLFNQSKFLEAIVHYEKHIALLTEKLQERRPEPKEIIYPSLNLARCYQSVGQMEVAAKYFQLVQSIATQAGDRKAESLSLVSLADILAANGKSSEANKLYQKAIEIDLTLDDRRAEAVDWFNYGQFLRRVGATDSLALACILRAEHLLKSLSVPEVETVGRVLEQMSSEMDKDSFEEVKKDFNKKSQQALSINLPSQ